MKHSVLFIPEQFALTDVEVYSLGPAYRGGVNVNGENYRHDCCSMNSVMLECTLDKSTCKCNDVSLCMCCMQHVDCITSPV